MTNEALTHPWRALTRVWAHRGYRSVLVSLVLSGISVSAYVPLVSLFLVRTLRADDASVGLFILTFLASPIVGIMIGRYSDRLQSRLPLLVVVTAWLALGRLAIGLAPNFAAAVVVGIVFGAFIGVPNAQTFAILRELVEREGEPHEATIASTVRSGYALGWAVGPLLGSMLAAASGYRVALAVTGLLVLLPLLPLRRLRRTWVRPPAQAYEVDSEHQTEPTIGLQRRRRRRSWGGRSLWLFAAVCLLALTGEALRLSYLPVLAVDRLGVPLWLFGVLVSIAPVIELGAMPAAGLVAERFGLKIVIFGGLLIGAVGFLTFANSSSIVGLLVGQILNACFTAVVLGLGVTYAQRLQPGGAGLPASVFFAAQSLSPVPAGLMGSVLTDQTGLGTLFLISAILCVGASVLLLLTQESQEPSVV